MTLETLRCFCAVVDEGSFHAAARRLHRSQPAISHQIATLEREAGHPLIDRKTSRPTGAGRLLYDRAKRLLADAENLQRAMAEFGDQMAAEISIGCSDTTALYVLPKAVRAFSKSHPQTRLRLLNRSTDELIGAVRRGDLDFAIVTLPIDAPDLELKPLFAQRFVLVVPSEHPFSRRNRIAMKSLRDEPFLQLDASTRTGAMLKDQLTHAGIAPPTVVDTGSFEVIKRYVAQGIGIALLPDVAIAPRESGLATVLVPELPAIELGAVWRRDAYLSRAAGEFLDLVSMKK